MLHQCCTCCSALVVLLEEIPNICLWVEVKTAAQPQNGLLCSVQAPAPVAFPMTTPQVPVYGMVKKQWEQIHSYWDQSIRNLIILSLFTWSCLFLTFSPGGLPVLQQAPPSNESSDGGRSHDAPAACCVQPASLETYQSLWAYTGDTGNTHTHT